MKKVLYLLLFAAIIAGLVMSTSCKRASVDDPNMIVNSGFRVILSGTANPSTLYVPEDSSSFSTLITVQAKDNKGNPLAGYKIIFEQYGEVVGVFDGDKYTTEVMTDGSGYARITLRFPAGLYVSASLFVDVLATFVDDGRLDFDSNQPAITDMIPVKVISNNNIVEDYFTVHGDILLDKGPPEVPLADVQVCFSNSDGTCITNSASGSYEILLPKGWTGTITPTKDGYTFSPKYRVISKPLDHDYIWEDFQAKAN